MPPGRRQRRAILERFLESEGLDRNVGATAGQLLDFRNDVALFRIEHDISSHSFRHLHAHWIAFDADDE